MTIDSPILGLLLLPVVLTLGVLAGGWLPAAGRWLLRGAAAAGALAAVGTNVRCERDLRVAVMVDVSLSTRGATFRDAQAVVARLTPLLAGRPYTLHYFADGLQQTADEIPVRQTRLEVPANADAVVLLSDGRFDAPTGLPPVYAVADPALDRPNDASVRDVRSTESGIAVDVISAGPERPLRIDGVPVARPPAGPAVIALSQTLPNTGTLQIDFELGDQWPENDGLRSMRVDPAFRRWSVDVSLAGFDAIAAADLPFGLASYLSVSTIVIPADRAALMPAETVKAYVRDLGGTLVLVGAPGDASTWRELAPLSSVPPAGPQEWIVLLDASGSMASVDATGRPKWTAAVEAARSAMDRLPAEARVTLLRFAGDVQTIITHAAPADARRALQTTSNVRPSGKTGLRAALQSLAERPTRGTARVLLLTDGDAELGEVETLHRALVQQRITLSAVSTTPFPQLAGVCAATGGRLVTASEPTEWANAFNGLMANAEPVIDRSESLISHDALSSFRLSTKRRWPAYAKAGTDVLADTAGAPVVAAWQVGLGRVASVAATLSAEDLAAIVARLDRPPVDPRFRTTFDEAAGNVCVEATDERGPMNGLALRLRRGDREAVFTQTGPGTYAAPLDRQPDPSVAIITQDNQVIARAALAGRYAAEFDRVGNDRKALLALADGTGGRLIDASETQPLMFPVRWRSVSLTPALAGLAAVLAVAAVLFIRRG